MRGGPPLGASRPLSESPGDDAVLGEALESKLRVRERLERALRQRVEKASDEEPAVAHEGAPVANEGALRAHARQALAEAIRTESFGAPR